MCCNKDKLDTDSIQIRRDAKREDIIEKIEDVLFYIKKMNSIYAKEIYYEGHDNFLKLLYHIENERTNIDLTVKTHNLYIQGEMARERKFDPQRMEENAKIEKKILGVDTEKGGEDLSKLEGVGNMIKQIYNKNMYNDKKINILEENKKINENTKSKILLRSKEDLGIVN